MGDCNLTLSFGGTENKEKYCKYSYCSWCPTCEKNSPRRRSRSETNEPCRRKSKEMKTLTPKKYNKCTEYENMELEYDYKGWHETKYECCRVRSNLVELPTSYISNNCQLPTSLNFPKSDSDFADCLKSVKTYEHTLKFVDFNTHFQNLDKMQENAKVLDKVSPSKLDSLQHHYTYNKTNGFSLSRPKSSCRERQNDNQDLQNSNFRGCDLPKSNCKEYCTLADLKHHDSVHHKPLCYDTDTYFDKRNIDSFNIQDRYGKEVAYLREKLKLLRNSAYYESNDGSGVVNNRNEGNGDCFKHIVVTTPVDIKYKPKKERRVFSPPLVKNSKSKVSIKTRKVNPGKMKKVKTKLVNNASLDATESDYSGSDSDTVDDDDEEEPVDEESESLSEPSAEESSRDSSDTTVSIGVNGHGSGDGQQWPMRLSLFPHIPPYIKFNSHDSEILCKLPTGKKFFKWKLSTITPIVVRKTLSNSGFALVRKSNQWLGTWGKHMKSPLFKTLKETQKLNHFPGTFQLGRKDRLWRNFQKMITKFGLKEFGFLPHSYILPQELKLLKQNWEFKNGCGGEMWIIKPPASARGAGIKVINKWSQLPKKTSLVVQKYISNPYLINGSKFDLRLYVLVTSFHPLRIYLYPDGLARFASAKYSDDVKDLKDRYMHLTNYSINKLSSQYTANEDANACHGHKWTISKLMEYLQKDGIDTKSLWRSLQQLVIKTIVSSESLITPLCEGNMNNLYNCYELFGIDVLLDEHLKPWLLEVNISPSLHSASPLDAFVKGPMVQTLFDMAQFHFPPRLKQNVQQAPECFDRRVYTRTLTKSERTKHVFFNQIEYRDDYICGILKDLTGDDIRHLTRAEDEYVVKGKFEKIFPTAYTFRYLDFMEVRYYNRLFDAWETRYADRRDEGIEILQKLCEQKIHLKVAPESTFNKSSQSMIPGEELKLQQEQDQPLEDIMERTSITNKKSVNALNF